MSDDLLDENIRRAREQEADGSAERRRQQMQEAQRVRVRADGARVPVIREDEPRRRCRSSFRKLRAP